MPIIAKKKGSRMPKAFKSFRGSDPELIYDPKKNQYQIEAKSIGGAISGGVQLGVGMLKSLKKKQK